jgi:hypothetical protein
VAAGLIGAAAVAMWFVYDTAMGRPLYTPALLGAAILKGLRDPSAHGPSPWMVAHAPSRAPAGTREHGPELNSSASPPHRTRP